MKRVIALCSALLLLVPAFTCASAAEAPPSPPDDAAKIRQAAAPPERKLMFEVSESQYEMKLFAADPKLLEQKYVAIIRVPYGPREQLSRTLDDSSADPRVRFYRQMESLLQAAGIWSGGAGPTLGKCFRGLISQISQHHLPPQDVVSFFSVDRPYLQFVEDQGKTGYEFRILAPTAKRAEQLAQGLMQIFDYGLFMPVRECLLQQEHEARTGLEKYEAEIAKHLKEVERIQKIEEASEPFSKDALADLLTQQRLLAVELAGVKARIDACQKILGNLTGQLSKPRVDQVEGIKIAAEIDLVSVTARMDAIKGLIEAGRKRTDLADKLLAAKIAVDRLQRPQRSAQESVRRYREALDFYTPFEVKDGKVMIHPIKWAADKPSQ
jgi:hypothetical protein